MRRSPSSHNRRSRGQALVEFAFVAPIFFFLLLGIIEGGRFMFYYQMLNNATREGARFAIVNGGNYAGCSTGPAAAGTAPCDVAGDLVVERVRDAAIAMDPAAITVNPTWWDNAGTPGTNARGQRVRVEASYTYTTVVPILLMPPINVNAESTLVVNN